MPACPECKPEVTYPENYAPVEPLYHYRVVEGDSDCGAVVDTIPLQRCGYYRCPRCGEKLFVDEGEAKALLIGDPRT